ncbi:hypothetical protein [Armatimonas sp.]|uniref:hypothetical protein n=1 Tax=Armatimonas sp. TaxID=1872638 RepID=UPI0037505904
MNTINNTNLSRNNTNLSRSTLLLGLALMGSIAATVSPAFAGDNDKEKVRCELRDSLGSSDKNSVRDDLNRKECREFGGKEIPQKKD